LRNIIHIHTTILRHFELCPGHPDEPVPEETFTHSHLSWSSVIPIRLLYLP